jgi:hypothetical protein
VVQVLAVAAPILTWEGGGPPADGTEGTHDRRNHGPAGPPEGEGTAGLGAGPRGVALDFRRVQVGVDPASGQ